MSLERITARHPTDKMSVHSYIPIYERLFAKFKEIHGRVMEIGTLDGGSLRAWEDWFTKASIVGVDINPKPPYIEGRERIHHIRGDAYTEEVFHKLEAIGDYNVIIDDGLHEVDAQCTFCANYVKLLAPGGIAVVEDVQDPAHANALSAAVPEGFHSALVDLRYIKNRHDDLLFLIWQKSATFELTL